MSASDLFKAGKLRAAIDAQVPEVRANPADPNCRLFLFELLAFAGELDRARKQIDAVSYGDAETDVTVGGYRKLLDAEEARRRLFADGVRPHFLGPPPEHLTLRLEAVDRLREGRPAEAATLLEKAAAVTPAVAGTLNGKPFTTLRDADDLFAGVLEVMVPGGYYWAGFEQIESLAINPPLTPRDLLWRTAHLETRGGTAAPVFLPVLYPNSHAHADDQVKLGRATDWQATDGGPVLGVGQHTFLVGEDAAGLLEWKELVLPTEAG